MDSKKKKRVEPLSEIEFQNSLKNFCSKLEIPEKGQGVFQNPENIREALEGINILLHDNIHFHSKINTHWLMGQILPHLSSADDEIINLALTSLKTMFLSKERKIHFLQDPENEPLLKAASMHPNERVRQLLFVVLGSLTEDLSSCEHLYVGNGLEMLLSGISDDSLSVFKEVKNILMKTARLDPASSSKGLSLIFTNQKLISKFKTYLQPASSSIKKLRVYELFCEMSTQVSENAFKFCVESGIFVLFFEELLNDASTTSTSTTTTENEVSSLDLLTLLNLFECLKEFGKTRYSKEYIISSGIIDKLLERYMVKEFNNEIVSFLLRLVVDFAGNVVSTSSDELFNLSIHEDTFLKILGNLDLEVSQLVTNSDNDVKDGELQKGEKIGSLSSASVSKRDKLEVEMKLKELTITVIATLCSHSIDAIEIFLKQPKSMENFLCPLKQVSDSDLSVAVLHSLGSIFETANLKMEKPLQSLYHQLDAIMIQHWNEGLISCVMSLLSKPFHHQRMACLHFLKGLSNQPFGVELLMSYPGYLMQFLLNRETELMKDGKEWKFAIVETTMRTWKNKNTAILTTLQQEKLKSYLLEGPFFVPVEGNVLVEDKVE